MMRRHALFVASSVMIVAMVVLATVNVAQAASLPTLNMSGFAWAENLAFDGNGNLFVADAQTGKIWRIYLDSASNSYKKTAHINAGFRGALGLAVARNSSQVYANVKLADEQQAEKYAVIAFSPFQANSYRFVAFLPEGGNGLALHYETGLLYATTEGFAHLGRGAVYEINPNNGVVSTYDSAFTADGAIIDQTRHLLYISEVVSAKIVAYNLTSHKRAFEYRIKGAVSLDDMCLTPDGSELIGADFRNRTVIRWNANGSGYASIQATELYAPTSVRIGYGTGFNASSIYITEGGGLTKFLTNRSVLEATPHPAI